MPLDVAAAQRRPLGTPRTVALPFHLRPILGADAVYAVHDDPQGRRSLLRRIVPGPEGTTLGPIERLDGRSLSVALEAADHRWRITAGDDRVCVEVDARAARCDHHDADAALLLAGETPVVLVQRPEGQRDDPHRGPSKKRKDEAKGTPGPVVDPPTKMEVVLAELKPDGSRGPEIDTGLVFARPLEGMGVIAAVGTKEGARLLYFEHIKSRREGRKKIRRARLTSARLDAQGKLLRGSGVTLYDGDRRYGYVEGHLRPRLWVEGDRDVFTERVVDPTRKRPPAFAALRLDGRKRKVTASDATLIVTPSLGPAKGAADAIAALDPRRDPRQTGTDAGRVLWAGARGYFLRDGALWTTTTEGQAAAVAPPPFEVDRTRLRAAGWAPDGRALAAVDGTWTELDARGQELRRAARPAGSSQPVLIGSSWWSLLPTRAGLSLEAVFGEAAGDLVAPRGEVKLVGGVKNGWWLARRGGDLVVASLSADGQATWRHRAPSPVRGRWAAVARPGGGAIVAGRAAVGGDALVAFAIDLAGKLTPAEGLRTWPRSATEEPSFTLAAHPGGAWILEHGTGRVRWLDRDGRPGAEARAPGPSAAPPCIDGHPIPSAWPGPTPETWVSTTGLEDACYVGSPQWHAGGLRWLGSRASGASSRAEWVQLPHADAISAAPIPTTSPASTITPRPAACPPEMVHVGAFCIDRFEARLVENGLPLSPDYPPAPHLTKLMLQAWAENRWHEGGLRAHALRLPPLQRPVESAPTFVAASIQGIVPSSFLSGHAAEKACAAAGKRLCAPEEWTRACKGDEQTRFPYGDDYEQGTCNVFRYHHPARILHHNPSVGHLDPRLNLVVDHEGPLRRTTGSHPRCASRWGDDAVYDMVGNLDEWTADKGGAFAGGFYARSTRRGCDAVVSGHPKRYSDYSLGVRCCRDAKR